MTDLSFEVVGARAERYAVQPTLVLRLRISAGEDVVHAVALQCQIRIEPQRRHYVEPEEESLVELFGTRDRWGETLRPFLWTHVATTVGGFNGSTEIDLAVPCTYDMEIAGTKFFHALADDGDVPLVLLFSGTTFVRRGDGLSVTPVAWHEEAAYRLPVRVWRDVMDIYFPNGGWVAVSRPVLDDLARFKAQRALVTWDETLEALLKEAGEDQWSADRFAAARAVADAVLYEGYVLYPYRASARKNQLRWQFGVLVPQRQAGFDDSERWSLRTECIVDPGSSPRLHVRVRCLQVQHRRIEEAIEGGRFSPTESLSVDDATWVEWDEAVERELTIAELDLLPTAGAGREVPVHLPAGGVVDVLTTNAGVLAGRAVRTRQAVDGLVRVETRWADGPGAYLSVAVNVENVTDWCDPSATRDDVARHSLIAVHTLLAVEDGAFVSLLEPPDGAAQAVAGCRNEGTFPVLVGPHADVVLSSPIILYDQPEIAPESVGDLFDATEIDEILGLRVLTLTDEEKAEARGTDARAAEIIDRFEDLPPEVWARLHGAVRSIGPTAAAEPEPTPWWDPDADAAIDPWTESVVIAGVEVAAGTKVVLRPGHRRADAHDIFLAGMTATVAGVFSDAEGQQHVAVTVDDDPATEELAWQGRYLFFHPDEVEVRESVER